MIGAGIIGSRVAYEASRGGLRVALVDAGDFGGATSGSSSKLIHGGLRYLAGGDLTLVRELQRERDALVAGVAPHLVRPFPLLLVVERGRGRRVPELAAALALYSLVSRLGAPAARVLTRREASAFAPVDPRAVRACGLVHEAVAHDARLTLATVRAAVRAGAAALNYVRLVGFECAAGRIASAALEDVRTGEPLSVRCRAVVNAAGPWVEVVRRLEDPTAGARTRLSKGVHAYLPLEGDWHAGVALFDRSRSALAMPWQGMLMLGVTDTHFEGDPGGAAPEAGDFDLIFNSFGDVLPREHLGRERIAHAVAGLRVLPAGGGETSRASRRHVVSVGRRGMVSVAGGKLTNHRAIALDALRRLPAGVRVDPAPPGDGLLPAALGGAAGNALESCPRPEAAAHLLGLYGKDAGLVASYADSVPNALDPIHAGGPDVWAQAHFAVDKEWALTVDDVAIRRTTLAVRGLSDRAVRRSLAALLGDAGGHPPDAVSVAASSAGAVRAGA